MKILWILMGITLSSQSFAWTTYQIQKLHKAHLKVLEQMASEQTYDHQKIEVKFSYQFHEFLEDVGMSLFPTAQADDGYLYCSYGGWPTLTNNDGDCLPPWNRSVRNDSGIKSLGASYTGKFSCGKKNVIRCNPMVFYNPEDPKLGSCVEAKEDDPNDVMRSCIEHHKPHRLAFIKKLSEDPKLFAKYLALAGEAANYCEIAGSSAPHCQELVSSMKDHISSSEDCYKPNEVFPHINGLITHVNSDNIDQLSNGLASQFLEYMDKYDENVANVASYNKTIYAREIQNYSKDPQTKTLIEKIKNNSTRCLLDSCSGSKKSSKSVGYCFRYVKAGLTSAKFHSGWIPGRHARSAGKPLKNMGFSNLMESDEYRNITPETAPVGSVLVYENTRGGSGHIEVKLEKDKYGSDYVADYPISERLSTRKLIGVYVKFPKTIDGLLKYPEFGDEL